MIIVRLSGDLGQQMFQYALGRRLARIHRTELKLDIGGFERAADQYALDRFKIRASIAADSDVRRLVSLHHLRGAETSALAAVRDGTCLTGHCWSLRYIAKLHSCLRRELEPAAPPQAENKKILRQIAQCRAVAIYLYKKPADASETADLPLDYYYRAADLVAERIKRPVFYLFSNAPDYFQQRFFIRRPHIWTPQGSGDQQIENFRLMRACRCQIIANAPLAWWAAWLNNARNKIVVTPRRWQTPDDCADEILPSAWIRIDNESVKPAAIALPS